MPGADPSAPAIDGVDPAGSLVALELDLRRADRERAGLANLGPGAVEFAAAMDANVARGLIELRGGATSRSLDGQLAALGKGPLAAGPEYNSMLAWATTMVILDDLIKEPKNGSVDMDPETVEVAGNTGTITTRMTVKTVVNGSRASVDITVKSKGKVVDKATGNVLYSIDSEASAHIDLDFCPDAAGHTTANVKLTLNEVYFTGGTSGSSGKGVAREFSGSVGITVGEDANIVAVEGTAQGSEDSKGGVVPPGGGDSDMTVATRTAGGDIANDGHGRRLDGHPRAPVFGGEGSTLQEQANMWGSMTVFVETMVTAAAQEAEKLWKSGKCVELIVDPEGGDVEADEVKDVTARLKHKIEGNDLDKPVEALLTGVKSIDPAGQKQPAPATVTYTAGPNENDHGTIAFKSVSNRGIAQKSVTFTVRQAGWKVTFDGTDDEAFPPVVKNTFTAKITDLTIKLKDNALTGTGKLHLKGKVTSGPCSGGLDQVATSTVTGTLEGTGPTAVLRIVIRSASPGGGVVHMRCVPSGGADIAAEGHAERFGDPLATLELPAAGGTVRVSKTSSIGGVMNVTIKGTFTVTKIR
jgi:hypothetical protein